MYNDYNNNYHSFRPVDTRCPGKEITTLVMGINSLVWGSLATVFFWHIIIAIVYGIVGIGCGIAATVLMNKITQQATVITRKAYKGNKMAKAGIICGAVAIVASIIFILIFGLIIFETSKN